MRRLGFLSIVMVCLLCTSVTVSCSPVVSVDAIYGTYLASYPFATETLTLNRDGTVVQTVVVPNHPPSTLRGSWRFEATRAAGRLTFTGLAVVADPSEQALSPSWRNPSPGVISSDVERHWFRVVIGSASHYPYVRQ